MNTTRQNQLLLLAIVVLLAFSAFLYFVNKKTLNFTLPNPLAGPSDLPQVVEPPSQPDIVMGAQSGRVAVIMYHNVVDKPRVWFDCTIGEFKRDLDEITQKGFAVLSLDQLYDHLTKGTPVPARSVVITFDDNYQGVFDNALPLLRQRKFPAAVFVHTAYVGGQTGWPKMTWDELKELKREGLITIGAHTVTHPPDLKILPPDTQRQELVDSKKTIEEHLGCEIPYMAYPDGSNDSTTQQLARDAGYKMSFTMEGTAAEGSPNILCVGRYEAKKFEKALEQQTEELASGQVSIADLPIKKAPISCEAGRYGATKLVLLKGGTPVSVLASGRKTVGDFVAENQAVAGINGTFFVMAAIASDDNRLIGPSRPSSPGIFMPDSDPYRLSKLVDRPMVLWGPTRFAIVPFQPGAMNQETIFKEFMPDYTDAFLAGAWIVHEGTPRTEDQMAPYASQDIMDPRKRAFFGVTKDGEVICGASQGSITTVDLAAAAAAAGAVEAVLLDSGFSTSVVFDGQILVSGHSSIDNPSRPVPHAIVLQGEKGTANLGDLKTVPAVLTPPGAPSVGATDTEERPVPRKRHRRHRRR